MLAQSAAPGLAPRAAAVSTASKIAGSSESAPRIVPRHTLRPYQLEAIEQLDGAIAAGSRAPLLVCPTGSGKTVIATALTDRAVARGERVLFLAPRRELVAQASRQLARAGIGHGVLLAGADAGGGLYSGVHVASVDTLLARMVRRSRLTIADPHLVIVDEAHLSITRTRQALLDRWPDALRIGLTATPTRKDGRALGVLYDSLVEPVTVADLQRDGYLCSARYYSLSEPDLARVRTVAGDFHQGELEAAVNRPELVGDVVATWLARAAGRRTVVFATSIKHSVALAEEFLRAGVAAEHVDADTPQTIRDAIFGRFGAGQTQVLCNCFLASYGFDLPELACVVLARPTKSLMLYLQMLGRGLRIADGKPDCLVLDHSGCVHRFGFAHDERRWTLEGRHALVEREKSPREQRELKMLECPECSAVFSGARLCPECGYFFAPKGKQIETLEGELVEIGERVQAQQREQMSFFLELRGLALDRGWKDAAAACQYKERFGRWPPRSWNQMAPAVPSVETRRWVQSRLIAWRKSRRGRAA